MPEPLRAKKKTKAKRTVELFGHKSAKHIRVAAAKSTLRTTTAAPTPPVFPLH